MKKTTTTTSTNTNYRSRGNWLAKGFENHLNNNLDALARTELTVNGACVGYMYQQNNPASFGGLLVEDGHISQQSLSRYFGDAKIG